MTRIPADGKDFPREETVCFSRATFSHVPHFIRVHWLYSRAKSEFGLKVSGAIG